MRYVFSFYSVLLILCFVSLLPSCTTSMKEVEFRLSEEELKVILDQLSFEDYVSQNIHLLELELLNDSSSIIEIIITDNIGQADLGLASHMRYKGFNVFLYGSSFLQSSIPEQLISHEASTIHWRPGLNSTTLLIKRRDKRILLNKLEFLPPTNLDSIPLPDDVF